MSNLTNVNILLTEPDGSVLSNHPFIIRLSSADAKGTVTVDNPLFYKTDLSGKAKVQLKPSNNHYFIEYSLKGNRIPKIFKFLVGESTVDLNLVDIIVDTTTDTNDVSVLLAELREMKRIASQYLGDHPLLIQRVEDVERALNTLTTKVTSLDSELVEINTAIDVLQSSYAALKLITEDLMRDKADKYLFGELNTKLNRFVFDLSNELSALKLKVDADKQNLAKFKLDVANRFNLLDLRIDGLDTRIDSIEFGQVNGEELKKEIRDELTVKWQNDIKGYDNDVQASLTDIRNVVVTADSALAERIDTTSAKVNDNSAEITEVRRTYVTKDEAVAFVGDSLRAEWQGDAADMIDKLQIGGRNLIKQSEAMRGVSTVAPDIIPAYNIETGELSRITVYTLSGFVRVTDNVKGVTVGFKNVIDDAQSRISSNLTTVDNEWVFFKYTFATGATTNHKGYVVVNHLGSTDTDLATVETKLMKLEIGVKATDWSPAVTDIDDKITVVTAQLDDFKIAQANKDGALTQRIENAESSVNDNKASIKSIEETYAKASEVGAISKSALEATWKGDIDNAVTAVTIGGKNYLDDGMFDKGYWQFYSDNNQVTGKSDGFKLSIDSTTNIATGEWYLSSLKSKTLGNIQSNKVHTISFTGYGDSAFGFLLVTVILRSKQNGVFVDKAKVVFNVEDINNRYVRQFNTGNLINSEELQLVFQVKSQIGTLWLNEIQLEIGNKVSDWTLAPSDYLEEIKETKASLEEFKRVSASANEALAERVTNAESQIGVTSGKITTVESTVSNLSNTVTTMNTTMDSGFKNSTAQYNSLANTVIANQSSTVTSLNSLSTRIDNINPDLVVKSTITNGSTLDHNNGNVVGNSPGWSYVEFMDVYENASYIFRVTRLSASNFNLRVVWYNESKQFISSVIHTVFEGAKTIQAPAGASYLRIAYSTTAAMFTITEIAASAAAAVSANLAEFKQSQATQNGAFANAITKNETAIGNNTSTLNTFANTYATKDAVGGLAKTALQATWQADTQARVDALTIGSRNYLLDSKEGGRNKDISTEFDFTKLAVGTVLSISFDIEILTMVSAGYRNRFGYEADVRNSAGGIFYIDVWLNNAASVSVGKQRVSAQFVITSKCTTNPKVLSYHNQSSGGSFTVSNVKLEIGSKPTDWLPAPEDAITELATMNSSIASLSQTVSNNQTSTATQIGQLTSNVSSMQAIADRAEGYVENGILYVPSPLGASYSGAAGNNAGAIRISLPTNPINAMIRFTVDIFNYVANTSNSYEISGYVNNTASPWLQNTAICTGAANRAFPVRFGTDDTGKACVWIGNLDSTWTYCRVKVRDLTVGYANLNKELWRQGWNITFVTAYNTVTATVNPFNGEKAAADVSASLDSYKTTQAERDTAQTLAIDNAVSRVGTLEGSVSNVTSTYAKKTEVGALANTALQSTWEGYTNSAVSGVRTDLTKAEANITTLQTTMASQGSAIAAQETTLKAAINNASKGSAFASDFKDPNVWYSHYGTNISANFKSNITSSPSKPYAYYSGIGNDFNYSTQVVNIVKGHKYKFSAWFYNAAGNGLYGFNWKRQGTLNNYAESSVVVPNGGGWHYKEVVVTAAVLGDWAIQPGFYVNHTSTAGYGCIALYKFEDVTLEENVKAQWTVTTEAVGARKAVAGLSLGVDGNTGESAFLVKANKFEIADSNNAIKAAFINNGLNPELVLDGSLSAQKVRIGIGANLVPDPFWESGLTGQWRPWEGTPNISLLERANAMIPASCPSTRVVRYSASVSSTVAMFSHTEEYTQELGGIPVVGGEVYKIGLDYIKAISPATSGTLSVMVYFYNQTDTTSSLSPLEINLTSVSGGVWTSISESFTVPAAAVKMRMYILASGFIGTLDWCNPYIMKMTTGDLIVNGGIQAQHLAANSVNADHIVAKVALDSPVINAGTINGGVVNSTTFNGGNINIGGGVFTVDNQGNVTLTKGQINIADNFIVDSAGNLTAKSGRFEGTVSADSIDTPVAQTFFANVGSYTTMIPPSTRARRLFISTFTCQVIPPPGWNHDLRGTYKLFVKVFQRTASGVVSILRQYGAEVNSSGSENYTVYGRSVSRTLYNIEIDVPLEGASYLVDVEAQWSFESTTFVRRNLDLGRIETNGASERTGTKIGQISRHLMQFTMHRNN